MFWLKENRDGIILKVEVKIVPAQRERKLPASKSLRGAMNNGIGLRNALGDEAIF